VVKYTLVQERVKDFYERRLRKKERKNITSETMKRIIPIRKPFVTEIV